MKHEEDPLGPGRDGGGRVSACPVNPAVSNQLDEACLSAENLLPLSHRCAASVGQALCWVFCIHNLPLSSMGHPNIVQPCGLTLIFIPESAVPGMHPACGGTPAIPVGLAFSWISLSGVLISSRSCLPPLEPALTTLWPLFPWIPHSNHGHNAVPHE